MGDHVPPGGAIALPADRHLHQSKILGLPIGSDDEGVAEMLRLVFVIAFVGQEGSEIESGIIGMRVPPFRGHRAFHVDEDEALGFRLGDAGVETLVRLLEDQRVLVRVLPQHVLLDVEAKQGLGILGDVEEGPVVVGPCEVGFDIGNCGFKNLAGTQILEAQGVPASADRVFAEREPLGIRRHFHGADPVVIVAHGEHIDVEHDVLGRFERTLAPPENRVFLAGCEARVIPVAVHAVGHAGVVLLHAGDDFLVERILEGFAGGRASFAIRILGREVGEHLRIRPLVVPQPVVGVHSFAMRRSNTMRPDRGHGGLESWFSHGIRSYLSSEWAGV